MDISNRNLIAYFLNGLNNGSSGGASSIKTFDQSLVSDETLSIYITVVDTWLSLFVSSIGVISNVLTITVFWRMGFKDTVNITMTTIAFWDLVRVLCGSVHRCYGPLSLVSQTLGKSWQNITIPNIVSLQNLATNVAYVIGGYVAVERCLCVSVPFKIKVLLTPWTTFIICLALSFIVFSTLFPSMLLLEFKWIKVGLLNEAVAIYQFTVFYKEHGERYLEFYQYFNSMYPMISLTLMLVSTAIISYHLHKSSQFRKQMLSSAECSLPKMTTPGLSKRDVHVIKMLLLVITSYTLVLVPRVTTFIVQLMIPEFLILRYYNNIYRLFIYMVHILDFINSSTGFIIFYTMSSRFRIELKLLFKTL